MLGAAVRVSGQRLVGCGAVGPPSRSLSPPSLPREVARAPQSGCTVEGAWVGGPGSAGGGAPRHCPPLTRSSPSSGPSPAPPLVWGLVLWRWRVSPSVAPVGEGVAQGPGGPVVGVRIRDAEHRPPLQEAGHVGSLSGHAAQITDRQTLSWSFGAAHPPGGTSWFAPSLRRSTASKGRFLIHLMVPEQAQLNHLYTSTTRGRASSPRGSGTVPRSQFQGRAPFASRAGSPGDAPRPPPAEAIRTGSALGAGGAGWGWGRGGCGRMSSPASGLML